MLVRDQCLLETKGIVRDQCLLETKCLLEISVY